MDRRIGAESEAASSTRGAVMARREWAQQAVSKHEMPDNLGLHHITSASAAKLLQAEHARAVRIVKRARKQYCPEHPTTEYQQGYMAACIDILAMLTKGRA